MFAGQTKHLLIVEDDRDLASNLIDYLTVCGYVTDYASDGLSAISMLADNDYDLAVLDLSLPGIDGLSLCRHIQQKAGGRLPIVVLTAKDEVDTKIAAFDLGADDYVLKPVALRELEARIRALIRRAGGTADPDSLVIGDLRVDPGTLKIERAGIPIALPPTSIKILILLMRNAPNVVTRQAIRREIWGENDPGESHALLVHMNTLRNAIDKPFDRQLIQTVRGFGYRVAADDRTL